MQSGLRRGPGAVKLVRTCAASHYRELAWIAKSCGVFRYQSRGGCSIEPARCDMGHFDTSNVEESALRLSMVRLHSFAGSNGDRQMICSRGEWAGVSRT